MEGNFTSESPKTRSVFGLFRRDFLKHRKSGFTLIELLVTIVIFVIITGVVLVNSNKFDSSVLLNNFAYDVALTIKQAQSYGVNVRENINTGFNTSASGAYGIYFDPVTDSTKFVLFNDTTGTTLNSPSDQTYNGNFVTCSVNDQECVQKFSMTKGTYVKRMCATNIVGLTNDCDDPSNKIDQLSILFYRPSLEARIYVNDQPANIDSTTNKITNNKAYAKITLAAADGRTVDIVVTSVGQIYVKK